MAIVLPGTRAWKERRASEADSTASASESEFDANQIRRDSLTDAQRTSEDELKADKLADQKSQRTQAIGGAITRAAAIVADAAEQRAQEEIARDAAGRQRGKATFVLPRGR